MKTLTLKTVSLVLILITSTFAAFEKKNIGTRYVALSGSGSASTEIDFATFINPAILIYQKQNSIVLFYKNIFGIKDLNHFALHSKYHVFDFPIGFGLSNFGNRLYNESELSMGTAFKLHEFVAIGISTSFYFLKITNYQSDFSVGFNIAFLLELNQKVKLAATAFNITEAKIGSAKQALPSTITLGLSYSPIPDAEVLLDVVKEDFFDFEYHIGARLNIIDHFSLLSGLNENTNSFSFGLEYNTVKFTLQYGMDFHPVLQESHSIGFKYVF